MIAIGIHEPKVKNVDTCDYFDESLEG